MWGLLCADIFFAVSCFGIDGGQDLASAFTILELEQGTQSLALDERDVLHNNSHKKGDGFLVVREQELVVW